MGVTGPSRAGGQGISRYGSLNCGAGYTLYIASRRNPEFTLSGNPFTLVDVTAYQHWRQARLDRYPAAAEAMRVAIDGAELSAAEQQALLEQVRRSNMVIYRLNDPDHGDKAFVRELGQRLGLERLDGNLCADDDAITSLQVRDVGRHAGYIPYTNRRLSWHTDGYYNRPEQAIRGILMHCVRDAAEGGENLLLDHEMVYIQLRDADPRFIEALQHPQAMTIPPNVENGQEIRAEQGGPVFSLDPRGNLHMRFSARTRNIVWRDDPATQDAVACLNELLTPNNPYVIRYRLNPGEGIICNNVLHNRTEFTDHADPEQGRLLYRARYYDRISNTDLNQGS